MRTSHRRLLLSLLLVLCAACLSAAPRFAHEESDLKPDSAAHFGTLKNGLRYVVYPNHEPKGRASLRLLVLAGSFQEREDERGVAHFLEHMAFNGSEHYAPGTLVEFFQRMGMNFGGDTNASTGYDRTLYLLELPNTRDETLAEGLRVLGDYAGGLLLSGNEIDKERGIILSEKRTRDSVAFRTQVAQMEFFLEGTRLPARMPIGQAEVIEKAPRERFTGFWNAWYRPENMAAIVVGDVDAATAEKLIETALTPLTARGDARPAPTLGAIAGFTGVHAAFHGESEAPATEVTISCISPYSYEPDTAARRLARLPRQLAVSMLNRRLSVLAKAENAPFSRASVEIGENFDLFLEASISLECKPGQWQAALALGEQELRRAIEHGFQPDEMKEVVADYSNSLNQAVNTASTRRSSALAGSIAQSILRRTVFTSPATVQALYRPALEKTTPADCAAAFRAAFAGNGRGVMVTGNAKIPGDAVAAITTAYEASRRVAVAAPAARAEAVWSYTDFGTPGTVVKRARVDDLDVTLVTFSNGARLNLKKTDFEAGRIEVRVRVGNGLLGEPPDKRGLAALAARTFIDGGLGRLDEDDLRRATAGKTAAAAFLTTTDALTFLGTTNRTDLAFQLQLLAAYIVDPGYRPEALRQARKAIEEQYLGFEHTVGGPMSTDVANLIAGGDPRFGLPPKETMLARNLDEVRSWFAPQLAHGALEVSVVGDIDIDATIDAAARTFGALPARESKPAMEELRKVAFPATPFIGEYTISSEIPKGLVTLYWPTTDGYDAPRTRRLTMLASVFGDRLRVKIREEMGGTYSPRATNTANENLPGYGYVSASIDVAPETAAKIADVTVAIADDLAKNGVTAEELDRARKPALTAARQSMRENTYWLTSVLARAQERPEMLDWARTRLADIEAITKADLDALARAYLGREQVSRVTVLPAKK